MAIRFFDMFAGIGGFTDEQFDKAAARIHADGHLYKMAGNSVSVPAISATGRKTREVNDNYHTTEERHA